MTQTQNYWYIDVKEDGGSEFTVGPIGMGNIALFSPDGHRALPEGFTTTYSAAGAQIHTAGAVFSPPDLVDLVQAAFDEALESGLTDWPYLVSVKALDTAAVQVNSPAGSAAYLAAETFNSSDAVVLQYTIISEFSGMGAPPFELLFTSGPNGLDANSTYDGDSSYSPNTKRWPVAEASVINKSSPIVVSTPYCTQVSMMLDYPPVPPDVVFIPYVGVNNKIMVLFSSNAGIRLAHPVILKNSDASFIADDYYAQKGITVTAAQVLTPDTGELTRPKLEYRNDGSIRKYELFRVDKMPTSYDDFHDRNLTAQPIDVEIAPNKFSTSPAFVDTIQPNKKYWYCARSVDLHNNISNPTYIFEIEMVDNKGQMYMRHKVVNFEPQVLNYKKMGRKILAIEPRNVQRYYNAANPPGDVALNQIPTSNILGTSEVNNVSSIWNKKFKVRITSKKTGRKIDLNLTFKNTGVVIP